MEPWEEVEWEEIENVGKIDVFAKEDYFLVRIFPHIEHKQGIVPLRKLMGWEDIINTINIEGNVKRVQISRTSEGPATYISFGKRARCVLVDKFTGKELICKTKE